MPNALTFSANGDWKTVLSFSEIPSAPLSSGCVRLRLLAAAIHPSDFGQIAGTYGKLRSLPAIAGREGVGEVIELAKNVRNLRKDDWVRLPETQGVWASEIVCPAKPLFALPKDVPATQLALSFINPPTAYRVLHDFAKLKKGDSIITNAGKSGVSEALIRLGSAMGLKVYAVVRDNTPTVDTLLRQWGAAGVFDEKEDYFKTLKARLALNQIGGESVLKLIKSLDVGGGCVTIGGAAKEPVRYPTRELIFNDISLRGFWMDKWLRENSPAATHSMMKKLWSLMQRGELSQTVAQTFSLSDYAQALESASSPGRIGKILFAPLS